LYAIDTALAHNAIRKKAFSIQWKY
jgi:hypothetical protein